ncbi:Protein MEMO1 [Madurella mycetomatis]|uniref:Protein MEMO1 n=1 Tax=Madurella mycetomatis TaxID=100816 RepID=A0A175VT63_9PEZI|nr:Protein MEMO1 [Madurella mycetomatis]
MLLKRKRSDSELSSGSSTFSSLLRPDSDSFSFDAILAMDTSRRGFFSPRLPAPSHLPSRTMKRFRNNRPSDAEVHQHTLDLLYSARHHHPQQPQLPPTVNLATPSQPQANVQPQRCSGSGQQRSLHAFWDLPRSSTASTSNASSVASSPDPSSSVVVGRRMPSSTTCEDCGAGLRGSGDDDDVMMDIVVGDVDGGYSGFGSSDGDDHTCGACGRRPQRPCEVKMGTREASHAGSWYEDDAGELSSQLDKFLDSVPATLDDSGLPIPGARVIIAPHAGYSYSGPCAAWAYKALDLSAAKRVFVLGPSHTYYLRGCALTTFDKYATPFGDLIVDKATTSSTEYM